jgi:hypothetical protein
MEKPKTKTKITISIDKNLNDIMEEIISNKSKYIEWLIYQDLLKTDNDNIKKIIL